MAEQEQEQNTISSASKSHADNANNADNINEQHEQPTSIKIVLTANNHLGRDIVGQRRREERLQRLRDAFQQATSFAVAQGADVFIQAGDLFDTITPSEQDRTFVASCLARLKQAGIAVVALGGTHDTPVPTSDDSYIPSATSATSSTPVAPLPPAPQRSYAQLGALHYFSPLPHDEENEPLFLNIRGIRVGIAGIGWIHENNATKHTGQGNNPFARVRSDVERAALPLLVLHAPVEGITSPLSRITGREAIIPVKRDDIAQQSAFHVILDGYAHSYSRTSIGSNEVISAGSTQSDTDEDTQQDAPGFVYLGLTSEGVYWCNHVSVDALLARQLTIFLNTLWPASDTSIENATGAQNPTDRILEQLEPLCNAETMLRLRLEGEITRSQYHLLDEQN
ncbi:MAG TPA: hypothetical protein DHW02_01040, partial [Ktedonobacter sp.]|nr:hypothetical protein [Ktedonobacter sp.]